MKKLLLPLLIFFISGCRSFNSIDKTNYNFDVSIIPSGEKISSEVKLSYLNSNETTDSIAFLLHKNFVILSLSGENIADFSFDTTSDPPFPFTPEAGRLTIKLKNPVRKNEKVDMMLKYSGTIGIVSRWQTNRIERDWVELGLYTPWFPFDPDMNEFSYSMNLSLPEGFKAKVNGHTEFNDGVYKANNPEADNDIVITASKKMKEWTFSGDNLSLSLNAAVNISDSTAEGILSLGKEIFRNYRQWFGSKKGLEASVVISPRETGGGYARKGFIVLSRISDTDFAKSKTDFTRYFAHEFAHLWFASAPKDTWEDWLNESFAEYASLMMVREASGEKEFLKRINRKKEKINRLPGIRGLDRKSEEAYLVLYNKGCFYLYELERELGKSEFMKFFGWAASNHITSTDMLLMELEKRYGKTLAVDFSAKLDR